MKQVVHVRAFPRLHVTLIDLGGATHRRYGGAGFSLDGPWTDVEAMPSRQNTLELPFAVDERDRRDVQDMISRLSRQLRRCFAVAVRKTPPLHIGLGTKTALLLATARSCMEVVGREPDRDQLQRVSRRGAASGVGINAFFPGGLVVDLGHPTSRSRTWLPSGASVPKSPPPVGVRSSVPEHWVFHLFLLAGKRYHAGEEVEMFRRNTPVPRHEVTAVLAEVYHGLVPAVICDNLPLLKTVLRTINRRGFKRAEVTGQPRGVRAAMSLLDRDTEAAVGMSSMGPLVYAITDSRSESVQRLLNRRGKALRSVYIGCYPARNTGHEVLRVAVK